MMDVLRVLLQIEVKPGRERDFEELWCRHSAFISHLPHNRGQSLLRRADNPAGYVVITDWVDEEAFRSFEHSEPQQEYLKKLWPLRASGSMALLNTVYQLPTKQVAAVR